VRPVWRAALLLAGLCAALACRRPPPDPWLTYFDGEHALSLRHPASWKAEQSEQGGVFYRHFQSPPSSADPGTSVTATLLASQLAGSLDEYAQAFLVDQKLLSAVAEARGAARGKAYVFTSSDGATRHTLLLLQEGESVYGLHCQGAAGAFEVRSQALAEITRSLTLERLASYPEHKDAQLGFSLRLPPCWTSTRAFSGGGSHVEQFASPALAAERQGPTVHATLTLTVEPAQGDLDAHYQVCKQRLGDAYQVFSHTKWRGGYVDVLGSETQMAVSRSKRLLRLGGGRAYTLALEAREDVYPRAARWYDLIAGSFEIAGEGP